MITNSLRDVLTLHYEGEELLPVFSHREEAEKFLLLARAGYDWRASESDAWDLVVLLCGPCASVSEVALDPLPEMIADRSLSLVSLCRERFLQHITRPEPDTSSPAYRGEATRGA